MIEPNLKQTYFSSNKFLSRSVLILASLFAIISLASIVGNYSLLGLIASQNYEISTEFIKSIYSRQILLSFINVLTKAIFFVVFLVWVYKSNRNLNSLGVKNKIFSSGWSIGWFFIPVMCIFKPYQVMKEIWNESTRMTVRIDSYSYTKKSPSGILVLWWIINLISSNLTSFVFQFGPIMQMMDLAYGLPVENMLSNVSAIITTAIISNILDIISYAFAAYIVHKINSCQIEKYEILKAQEQSIPDDFRTNDIRNSADKFPPTYTPFS